MFNKKKIQFVHQKQVLYLAKEGVAIFFDLHPYIVAPINATDITWHFLNHGGHIDCQVAGHREFGHGLEVPCNYIYIGSAKAIKKLSSIKIHEQPRHQ